MICVRTPDTVTQEQNDSIASAAKECRCTVEAMRQFFLSGEWDCDQSELKEYLVDSWEEATYCEQNNT